MLRYKKDVGRICPAAVARLDRKHIVQNVRNVFPVKSGSVSMHVSKQRKCKESFYYEVLHDTNVML